MDLWIFSKMCKKIDYWLQVQNKEDTKNLVQVIFNMH